MSRKAYVLNLGCGTDKSGDVRLDVVETSATTHTYDGNKIPFPENTFDIVLCHNVLEHVPNLLQFVQEAARVLKPGGEAYFITDNAGYLGYHLKNGYCYDGHRYENSFGEGEHFFLFKPSHLYNLMRDGGLNPVDVRLLTKWPTRPIVQYLCKLWPDLFFAQIYVTARKPRYRNRLGNKTIESFSPSAAAHALPPDEPQNEPLATSEDE